MVISQGIMASHNERRIATEIMKTVRRLDLPLKLDEITEGRGNCFPLSVLAQCRRSEIFTQLNRSVQALMHQNDPTSLRRAVHTFMTNSKHTTIQQYRRRYEEVLSVIDQKTWQEYWKEMITNYTWADYIFIQSTAWFLHHDIIIVTTTSTESHPYLTISGNMDNENVPCPGIELTIGSKSQVHYQSLLPLSVRVQKIRNKANLAVDTINLRISSSVNSSERSKSNIDKEPPDDSPNIDSRVEFPDLGSPTKKFPSLSRQKSKTSTKKMTMEIKELSVQGVPQKSFLYFLCFFWLFLFFFCIRGGGGNLQ